MAKPKDGQPKLPNMNEFSPGVLEAPLRQVLTRLAPMAGNDKALLAELVAMSSKLRKTPGKQRDKRARNVLIGMSQCGLFELYSNTFTELAKSIVACKTDRAGAEMFAAHVLKNLHGGTLATIVAAIRANGQAIDNGSIRKELRTLGFFVTHNEANPGKLRQWLEEARVVDEHWVFDDTVLRSLTGATLGTLQELDSLTSPQVEVLNKIRSQAEVHGDGAWIEMSPLKTLIDLELGDDFLPEGKIREKVLDPLEAAGWIETRGKGAGRGGNFGHARPTQKLLDLQGKIPRPFEAVIPAELKPRLKTPIGTILNDLNSANKQIKGIALELLGLRILIDLGLNPVGFRLRAEQAAYAEADLTADGIHLHYSRWLVQCKNTDGVPASQLVREVGLATIIRAHVVMMITTGKFGAKTRQMGDQVSRQLAIQVLFLDGSDLKAYAKNGIGTVIATLKKQATHILDVKAPQLKGAAEVHGIG